jgi:arogenate/prephenate dehydratase
MRVAFLGQPGSHSEGAALQAFGPALEPVCCESFGAIFAAVSAGRAERAVVPIENSLAGSLHSNYDLLLQHELQIAGEVNYQVRHVLLALPGVALAGVRRVLSHPQALDQCDRFLTRLGAAREPQADTTLAARRLAADDLREAAAIASRRTGEVVGLAVLAEDIADYPDNVTRFLILAREAAPPAAGLPAKTSLVFSLANTPGSLHRALAVFAERGINLTKIESRPLRRRRWEYFFYLDFAVSLQDRRAVEALAELAPLTAFVRVLGSYLQDPN